MTVQMPDPRVFEPAPPQAELIPLLNLDEQEVDRQMRICNACRYCEGFCAVFPAMTRRLDFGKADIHYLANLCHNCGACLHACQYAAPHAFAVNVPQAMAKVRGQTYAEYAWPARFGQLYRRNGTFVAVALALALSLFLLLALQVNGTLLPGRLAGDFYAVFPHNTLALLFGGVFSAAGVALAVALRRFWRTVSPAQARQPANGALPEAASAVLTLKYLDGGHGQGCNNSDDRYTLWRRRYHHLTFYGFMLCFAATVVATGYHYLLGLHAPYPLLSLPVVLGTLGGIGLIVGPAGLLALNLRRAPEHGDAAQRPMDRAFILLLLLVSTTGMALLALRDTGVMAILLAVHLGTVMALFVTLPYGKFAHGLFRSAALLKFAIEKRRPDPHSLGGD
ncbi:tricarballylate utilization 4Fe-4S protein TcuB [Pseudomonas sp. GD03862]|uniref:tricarballylate utilization 4Fe-4S protein TcuB n=1 Tax=unclassified Pseudomonas TaxID=196821 RepID=UPI001860539B|nr:tricarballylate utilization 4Fe-4S protein TcuB [Pseudomonas sp. GD03862]MDH0708635.1 tricarballylate utilization 4Fe-4S protein TcuB [Pseudomonas sp. GD03862]QNV68013.1 tricarballylate utilization 4Fe-4S protein TcuB [Pseudomonas sp. CFA]